jgi:hypothetical protein
MESPTYLSQQAAHNPGICQYVSSSLNNIKQQKFILFCNLIFIIASNSLAHMLTVLIGAVAYTSPVESFASM